MGIEAALIGGASLLGSAMSSSSARKAADTQTQAAREANELQREQFDAIRGDLEPYRDLGAGSTNLLAQYLGLPQQYEGPRDSLTVIRNRLMESQGPRNGTTQDGGRTIHWIDGVPNEVQYVQGLDDNDPKATYVPIQGYKGAQPYGGSLDSEAQRLYDQQEADYAKWQAGQNALAQNPQFGSLLKNFTGEDLQNEPGYQFGLAEGNKALDRRFASGGNYFSGAALKGATRYAQDYAGTKYGEAFNRDAANKGRVYNFLTGATGIGQNAAAQTGSAGQAMASNVGQTMTGAANAAGASQIAQGNAWAGGLNNIAGMYQQNQLIDKITAGNRGFGSGPSQSPNAYALGPSFDQYRTY